MKVYCTLTKFNLILSLFLVGMIFPFSASTQLYEYVRLLDNWHDTQLSINNINVRYNETWGFVQDGKEYAVIGSTMGVHIFLITDKNQLKPVDFVPGANTGNTVIHRDFKDYGGYLYAVCDQGASTLQVMDLRYLPDSVHVVFDSPVFSPTSHNIFIDNDHALLYMCGPIGAAMKVLSLANPESPVLVHDFLEVSYVHDAYVRDNIAYLSCANQGFFIYDFTNPALPVKLGSLENYQEKGYNHSGWLNEKGDIFVFTDENEGKRMKICDVSDPSNIQVVSLFNSGSGPKALPHNVMIKNDLAYVAHYKDGLQIFDIRNPARAQRVGFYETYPIKGPETFNGAWGIYALLPSGRILVSDMSTGLYLFAFDDLPAIKNTAHGVFPNPAVNEAYFYIYHQASPEYDLHLYNSLGQLVQSYHRETRDYTIIRLENLSNGMYYYRYVNTKTDAVAMGKFQVMRP